MNAVKISEKFKRFMFNRSTSRVGANFRMFPYDDVYEVYLRNVELHFHTKKSALYSELREVTQTLLPCRLITTCILVPFSQTRENICYYFDIAYFLFHHLFYLNFKR